MAKLNITNGESGSSVRTKLNTVDNGATVDQTGAQIKTAYEAEADTNAFTDAEQSKLAAVSGTNTGDQTITLTGDVTGSGVGSFAATIGADTVTYDKMQDVSGTDFVLGRSTAGAGTVEEIICTAAGRALIDDATAGDQRTTLGLGTIATQASSSVSITGGSVTGITDITLADGGTGQSTAQAAIDALTDVASATNEQVLTKDTGTGNAIFKTLAGGGDALVANPLSQFAATTSAQLAGVVSDETGSGLLCFATSPTLITPVLGAAAATTVNKVTITAPATGSTLTIVEGATLTASATASVSGTNTGDQTITLTGDVTGSGTGSFAATIGADTVTYDKMQDTSGTDFVLGRSTAGAGTVEEIICTAAGRALIDDATAGDQRTTLGLGTIATQASSSVSITGGTITGITDLTVADGGTGQSTAQAAIDALTAVSGATNEYVLTKDTGTGNATYKIVQRSVTIYAIDFSTAPTAVDGVAYFRVPVELNGLDIIAVGAQVGAAQSTSGTPTVQIARLRAATAGGARAVVDVLSTLITIDINEWDSKDATAAAVINTANDDVATGDLLRIDVDVVGTGTQGLFVSLQFG